MRNSPIVAMAVCLMACSWLTPKHAQDVATIVECVLANETQPPAQIAITCGIQDVQEVIDILSAHKLAEKHEQAESSTLDGGRQ